MPGFDPNEKRDALGRWTDEIAGALHMAATDTIKLYHVTKPQNVESIKKKGLVVSMSTALEHAANEIWLTTNPEGYSKEGALIEVTLRKNDPRLREMNKQAGHFITVKDIKPSEISNIYEQVKLPSGMSLRRDIVERFEKTHKA